MLKTGKSHNITGNQPHSEQTPYHIKMKAMHALIDDSQHCIGQAHHLHHKLSNAQYQPEFVTIMLSKTEYRVLTSYANTWALAHT